MPRSLKWLPEAVEDLDRPRESIRIYNPDAARRAAGRIREAARKLLNNPEIGRPVPDIGDDHRFGHVHPEFRSP